MNEIKIHQLTEERWADFEKLFGPRGACAGCWCMYWKLPRKEFTAGQYEGNRLAQSKYVASGSVPGLLAYLDGLPVGWSAVEPRPKYPVLARSRVLAPLDETPVWSITCFFVDRPHRRHGITVALLRGAIDHVKRCGGNVVEGYPTEPRGNAPAAPAFVYTGLASAFRKAGFVEAGRRSETRPIMRFYIR